MNGTSRPSRRRAALATVVVTAALALTACGGDDDDSAAGTTSDNDSGSDTRSVEADNGTIEVPADPRQVATIGNTTLPFIDLGGEPIGVTAEADSDVARLPEDQQATYASATLLAASADEVDMEQLA